MTTKLSTLNNDEVMAFLQSDQITEEETQQILRYLNRNNSIQDQLSYQVHRDVLGESAYNLHQEVLKECSTILYPNF